MPIISRGRYLLYIDRLSGYIIKLVPYRPSYINIITIIHMDIYVAHHREHLLVLCSLPNTGHYGSLNLRATKGGVVPP